MMNKRHNNLQHARNCSFQLEESEVRNSMMESQSPSKKLPALADQSPQPALKSVFSLAMRGTLIKPQMRMTNSESDKAQMEGEVDGTIDDPVTIFQKNFNFVTNTRNSFHQSAKRQSLMPKIKHSNILRSETVEIVDDNTFDSIPCLIVTPNKGTRTSDRSGMKYIGIYYHANAEDIKSAKPLVSSFANSFDVILRLTSS